MNLRFSTILMKPPICKTIDILISIIVFQMYRQIMSQSFIGFTALLEKNSCNSINNLIIQIISKHIMRKNI